MFVLYACIIAVILFITLIALVYFKIIPKKVSIIVASSIVASVICRNINIIRN